jgi:hypothetical protein
VKDTSVIITNTNTTDFQDNIKSVFECLNKWFASNLLSLNVNKTNIIHFTMYGNLDILINSETKVSPVYLAQDF